MYAEMARVVGIKMKSYGAKQKYLYLIKTFNLQFFKPLRFLPKVHIFSQLSVAFSVTFSLFIIEENKTKGRTTTRKVKLI